MEEEQNRQKQIPRSDIERDVERRGEGGDKEIKKIRTEKKVWKYINQERKEKESVSEEIAMQE
jgi:hypothetical protein